MKYIDTNQLRDFDDKLDIAEVRIEIALQEIKALRPRLETACTTHLCISTSPGVVTEDLRKFLRAAARQNIVCDGVNAAELLQLTFSVAPIQSGGEDAPPKSVIVYGPQGIGKGIYAPRMMRYFKLDHRVDEFFPGDPIPENTLVLTCTPGIEGARNFYDVMSEIEGQSFEFE